VARNPEAQTIPEQQERLFTRPPPHGWFEG